MKRSKKSLIVPNGRFKIGIPLFITLENGESTMMILKGNDEKTSIAYTRVSDNNLIDHDFFIEEDTPNKAVRSMHYLLKAKGLK